MEGAHSEFSDVRVISAKDVSIVETAYEKATAFLVEAEVLSASMEARQQSLSKLLQFHSRLKIVREFLDASTTRAGGLAPSG